MPVAPAKYQQKNGKLAGGVIILLFAALIVVVGCMPEARMITDPAIALVKSSFAYDPVILNTTSVDPEVSISIDELSYSTGGKTTIPNVNFVIGITNHHRYGVIVRGMCTFTDASGRLITTEPFPDYARYHLAGTGYSIPAGEKMSYRFFLRTTPPDDTATRSPPGIAKNQSYRNKGMLSCTIQNVSAREASG